MFIKAGSIIPMGPDMQYVDEKPLSELTLEIYPSKKKGAKFELYEDDGISLDYKKEAYTLTKITCGKLIEKMFEINISAGKGNYEGKVKERNYLFKIHRQETKPNKVIINGTKYKPSKNEKKGWDYGAKDKTLTFNYSASTEADINVIIKK